MADRILSCFIDEAGDFGEFESHSPYYIVAIVTHEQSDPIQSDIDSLENYLSSLGFPHHALHTGPLIRRESDYENMNMEERKKLFNLLFRFTRKIPIHFFTAKVRKSECKDSDVLEAKITKEIKAEIEKNDAYWRSFDKIIIYYDNGQKPLKRILNILFNSLFSNVEVRKVSPADYKLFQVADLVCTLDHIKSKIDIGQFSNSETEFFESRHEFKKNFWRKLEQQRM
ncbi:MAG: DUF3800 domain-containing protein [Oscillospiraceae bacterium]|nr:DUF3800 domain-containing protein [Oscillospiraceae bacterium]